MKRNENKIDLFTQLAVAIFRVHGHLLEFGDWLGAPIGLNAMRWQILGAIEIAGEPLTAPRISKAMGITRQGVQKQLNAMVEEGMIEQLHNPYHNRSYLYDLSPKGKEAFANIQAKCLKVFDNISNPSTEEWFVNTKKLINAIADKAEEVSKK